MKYLLDTHIVLWLAENSTSLSASVKDLLLDEASDKYVSIASCWEVSIKLSLGKLTLEGGTNEFFRIIQENGFRLLQIEADHLMVLELLPFHHRDPFDRLLIASAISEGMAFITTDTQMLAYAGENLQVIY